MDVVHKLVTFIGTILALAGLLVANRNGNVNDILFWGFMLVSIDLALVCDAIREKR